MLIIDDKNEFCPKSSKVGLVNKQCQQIGFWQQKRRRKTAQRITGRLSRKEILWVCAYWLGRYLFYGGENLPLFRVGKNYPLGTPKTPIYGVVFAGVRAMSVLGSQWSTGHFFSVRSLFNGKSSDKSKEKSRSITASPPLQPVPHLFPFSTVFRQFLGVRSWFVRGSTPFCDSENTCLCRYKMEADRSGRFEHLPLTRHYALVVS